VAGREHGAGIVELDAHAVALSDRQQFGFFMSVAAREVEHAKADAQRFPGRMHIA
jgi:hypothetical protein